MQNDADRDTKELLIGLCKQTEAALTKALQHIDSAASAEVIPSLDIGFPHDAIRLSAGYPTGCLVRWSCHTPVVPVDTTVNVCTSTVLELDDDVVDDIKEEDFRRLDSNLNQSSYVSNFHRGNHFISFCRKTKTPHNLLVVHSSASEFKKQFNGLYPVDGNWFMDDIKTFPGTLPRQRLLTGTKAERFVRLAKSLEQFNAERHEFIAEVVLASRAKIVQAYHHHHYFMPDAQSVMIGSFLASPGEVVPIFSYPGDPILFFRVGEIAQFKHRTGLVYRNMVPHGWGKTSIRRPQLEYSQDGSSFQLNGVSVESHVDASLRAHPDLTLRRYVTASELARFQEELLAFCDGVVEDRAVQLLSFNKLGVMQWVNQ